MDPALKFVVDIQNSEKIQQLTSHINLQTAAISALNAQLKQGTINDAQFAAATRVFGESAAAATAQARQLEAAGHGAGRGLSQLSYAVDDIQYGFNAIVNNIPQIIMGLGGSVGIAGAVGIVAVAVNQLIKNWDALSVLWGGEGAKLPVLKSGLDGLEESLKKITEAIKDLKEAEEARAASGVSLFDVATGAGITDKDKLRKLQGLEKEGKERLKAEKDVAGVDQSDEEKDTGKLVRAAIGKMASGALMDVLTDQGMTPDEAKKAISGALGGNTGHLGDILVHTKGQRGAGFDDLANATPEAQQAIEQKRLDLAGGRLGRKQEEKAKDKNDKLVDELNEAGQNAKKLSDEEAKKNRADDQRERIQALQDQRDAVMEKKAAINDAAFDARHQSRPGQILDGAKAVVDMYQRAAGGNKAEEITKRTHELQEQANKRLDSINEELKKQQRVRPA